jgi:chromatin structure-remodeling complex protein RSC7
VGGKAYVKVGDQLFQLDRDNLVTREDPTGNTKIDINGNLLGGREFKAATFHVPTRNPDIKYMLAIECARSSGYRDSLYYFRRNPLMYKLQLSAPEKEYLIQNQKLHTNLRHRSVTMVTARSAFKQHGAKVIKSESHISQVVWFVNRYLIQKMVDGL